jgi:colanic acid/amylovoran biosynthesis glycosyltransferase
MKIGLVLPATPGYSETFFTNKIKGLQQHGHTVVLFVNSNTGNSAMEASIIVAPKLSGNSIAVAWLSFWRLFVCFVFHFKATKRLFQLDSKDGIGISKKIKNIIISSPILAEKLDWLHFGFGTMVIGRENVAQALGAKMAVSFRGFDHYVYPMKHKNCYASLFSKKVTYHVLSQGMKTDLIAQGIFEKEIIKITPAIDYELFSNAIENSFDNRLNIITISRLHWIKGLEYTLEALAKVKQNGISFHYTIIGEGKEKERLQFAVHQLGLLNEVTFTGKLSPEEVKTTLGKGNLYIQYSLQEGFCNAVLEAQAMGKICIASDADGLQENIIDGVTGFVVSKRNPLSLANKIIEVNSLNRNEKIALSNAAAKRVRAQFTLEKQMEQFIAFYDS